LRFLFLQKDDSLESLIKRINDYRQSKKSAAISMLKKHNPVFGGGGGVTKGWYKMYSELLNNQRIGNQGKQKIT